MREKYSPTHHEVSEAFMNKLGERFHENVSPIHGGCYFLNCDGAVGKMISKMMEFKSNVFCSRAKLRASVSQGNARFIIFIDARGWQGGVAIG